MQSNQTAIGSVPQGTILRFTPEPNSIYLMEARLMLATSDPTGGIRTGMKWPTSGIVNGVASGLTATAGNATSGAYTQAPTTLAVVPAGHTTANIPYRTVMDAHFVTGPAVTDDIIITLSSENGNTVGTLFAGSFMRYKKIA